MVRLHWLSGTFPACELDGVGSRLIDWFGEGEKLRHGINGYRSGVRFGEVKPNALLCWSKDEGGENFDRPEIFVDFPGGALDRLPVEHLVELISCCRAWGLKATRVDAAYDDVQRRCEPGRVSGEYAADRRRYGALRSAKSFVDHVTGGSTVQFGNYGKQGCGYMLSVYDKSKESGGEFEGVRFEARFFKETAELAFSELAPVAGPFGDVEIGEALLSRALGTLVGGALDFYDLGKDGSRVIAPWWAAIREELGSVKLRRESSSPSAMAEIMRQFRISCGSRLAAIDLYFRNEGEPSSFDSFVRECVSYGESRMKPALRRLAGSLVEESVEFESELPW